MGHSGSSTTTVKELGSEAGEAGKGETCGGSEHSFSKETEAFRFSVHRRLSNLQARWSRFELGACTLPGGHLRTKALRSTLLWNSSSYGSRDSWLLQRSYLAKLSLLWWLTLSLIFSSINFFLLHLFGEWTIQDICATAIALRVANIRDAIKQPHWPKSSIRVQGSLPDRRTSLQAGSGFSLRLGAAEGAHLAKPSLSLAPTLTGRLRRIFLPSCPRAHEAAIQE